MMFGRPVLVCISILKICYGLICDRGTNLVGNSDIHRCDWIVKAISLESPNPEFGPDFFWENSLSRRLAIEIIPMYSHSVDISKSTHFPKDNLEMPSCW